MASGRKEGSPYVGVQKPKSGGYAVEKRRFWYEGENYGKFFHRTSDERLAAFISDFVNYVGRINESTFNFANGRKVLEEHGPRLRQELEESLARCNWRAMDRKKRKEEIRDRLIHKAKELWNDYEGEILKDHIRPLHKGSSSNAVEQLNHAHEDSVQKQAIDHIRPLHKGSSSNAVEQLNHAHEDSVQEQDHIRPLHKGRGNNAVQQLNHEDSVQKQAIDHIQPLRKGSSNNELEQLNHGHEDSLAGECSMTKQIEEYDYNYGGLPKFDVDVGLCNQPPLEEPALKKKLPLPPSLEKDRQDSWSQTQEGPNEGTECYITSKMEIRCNGYEKWWEITDKFVKSECSQAKVSILRDQTAPTCNVLQSMCAQIQCALYEQIFDAVNDFIDLECISKEILGKYRAETEPILMQCRANWHS